MNFFHCIPAYDFRAALRVPDVHPKQRLHYPMEYPARKLTLARLGLVENCSRQPAGPDDAVRFRAAFHQIMKGVGRGGAVCVHIADEVGLGGKPQTFDQCPAFSDGCLIFQRLNLWKLFRDSLNHIDRAVPAAIQHDDHLKSAGIMFPEVGSIIPQKWFDPLLFVISGDEQQQTGIGRRHIQLLNRGPWRCRGLRKMQAPLGLPLQFACENIIVDLTP